MTRTPFDQFSKQFLEELLLPYGEVEISKEIPGEAKLIDLWFNPSLTKDPADLGLLGTIVQTPCLLEPYRNPPDAAEINSCLLKRFWLVAEFYRTDRTDSVAALPLLWILTPTASPALLDSLGAVPLEPGIYTTIAAMGTRILVIHQLPRTPDTLWLRLLGKGSIQRQAIEEVIALPNSDRRYQALRLLVNWKIMVDTTNLVSTEEESTIMALSQAFLEWETRIKEESLLEGRQEGRQEEREKTLRNVFRMRFGAIVPALNQSLQLMAQLSDQDYDRIFPELLSLGEAELIERWGESLGASLENLFRVRFGTLDPALQGTIPRIVERSDEEYDRVLPLLITLSQAEIIQHFRDIH
jgi:hypothetical protein